MKGVTPVISVILLLLIAVALVGYASTFFTKISTTATSDAENRFDDINRRQNLGIQILSTSGNNGQPILVTFKNSGTDIIRENEATITTTGGETPVSKNYPSSIPGSGITAPFGTGVTCVAGTTYTIKIDIPGKSDIVEHRC